MSSIHEVAKRAGVSAATVSRTFSDSGLIKEQTQERVREVARQLGYTPRRQRTPEAKKRGGSEAADSIGFQFFAAEPSDTLLSNMFYASILSGVQAEASALGLHLLLHTTDRHSLSQEAPKMILERAVGGMLLVGTAEPAILAAFAQYVPKMVLVDNRDETGRYESVLSDGFGGAFASVRLLLKQNHRRIGFFQSDASVTTFQDRQRGYACALLEAGIAPEPERVIGGSNPVECAANLRQALLATNRPTALLATNDENALLAMRICWTLGIRIPEDLSLIGFDDISYSQHAHPPLTTVRVDKEAMGRLAVRRLHARLQQDETTRANEPTVCNVVPVKLIERDSTRPL